MSTFCFLHCYPTCSRTLNMSLVLWSLLTMNKTLHAIHKEYIYHKPHTQATSKQKLGKRRRTNTMAPATKRADVETRPPHPQMRGPDPAAGHGGARARRRSSGRPRTSLQISEGETPTRLHGVEGRVCQKNRPLPSVRWW